MNPLTRHTAGLVLLAILAGCDTSKVVATARVELDAPTADQAAQTAVVLQKRFSELASGFSKVSATASGSGVDLVFTGDAPADDVIRRYASTQGIFRMFAPDMPNMILVSDQDVEAVGATQGSNGPAIDIKLSDRAGERLLRHTSRNVGRLLVTSWDGKEEFRATIHDAFGERFQTTGVDAETALLRVVMLRHGRLPVRVASVEIRHPQTS